MRGFTVPYLWEIEQCWFTEEYVSQVNSPTGQHLNLVFTEVVTSQEFTKVPAREQNNNDQLSGTKSRHDTS